MADPLTGLNDFLGNLQLDFGNPVAMASNIILSTIIGGIVILIVVEIFAKKSGAMVNPMHAFLLSLGINVINLPIIMGLIYQFIAYIPFMGVIVGFLPIIIWIVLTKLLFKEMEILHILIISILGYFLSIYLVPSLVGMVSAYIPSFG
jgi:hypothetical protein